LVLHRSLLIIAVEQFISSVLSWQLYSPLQTNAYGKHWIVSQRNKSDGHMIESPNWRKKKDLEIQKNDFFYQVFLDHQIMKLVYQYNI
jgi:hypothetical protein